MSQEALVSVASPRIVSLGQAKRWKENHLKRKKKFAKSERKEKKKKNSRKEQTYSMAGTGGD